MLPQYAARIREATEGSSFSAAADSTPNDSKSTQGSPLRCPRTPPPRPRTPGSQYSLLGSPNEMNRSFTAKSPMAAMLTSPNKRKGMGIQGDRFIPSRTALDMKDALAMEGGSVSAKKSARKSSSSTESSTQREEAKMLYMSVLRTELFGADPVSITGGSAGPSSHSEAFAVQSASANEASNLEMTDASAFAMPTVSSLRNSSPSRALPIAPKRSTRGSSGQRSLFTYASPPPANYTGPLSVRVDSPTRNRYSVGPVGVESQKLLQSSRKETRHISKVPTKVLDAPDLQDDFYLNLVDWSSTNILAVGLKASVYLWNASTSKVTKLCELMPENNTLNAVTSVSWMMKGTHIAVGTSLGAVQVWDVVKGKKIRTFQPGNVDEGRGHQNRVGTLAWNDFILTSGSRDRRILHRDVRSPQEFFKELKGHKQEVCGLKWNYEDQMLASGGNDNKLFLWDRHSSDAPLFKFTEHTAAVKAIAWSPHQRGLLSSGGGTHDKKIRFWNTITGTALQSIDTGSQVCNLTWSKNANEIVSTHGYSQNQIILWKYPSMQQLAVLTGHTFRVLYLATSPDGQTVVTGAGDETLRFWNVFRKSKLPETNSIVLNEFTYIR